MVRRMSGTLPKRWSPSHLNLTEYHLNTQKVKTVQKLTQKSKHKKRNQKYRLGTVSNVKFYWGL